MSGLLPDKAIVIIGGTTGMGLSAARAFVREGAQVVVLGRDADSAARAQEELGVQALALAGDAIEENTAAAAIQQCVAHFGRFDGLYHVAGGSGRKMGDGPLHELSLEGWEYTLQLNLTSLMLSNRAAIRYWLDNRQSGALLNMGSVLGYAPAPQFFATHAYAAAKAAIIGFSKSIAAYYAPQNIRVNVIAPALVDTPMARRAAENAEIMDFVRTKQPLDGGRIGRPEDLDGLALYFLSDQSRFTTGQVVAVDGGWTSL